MSTDTPRTGTDIIRRDGEEAECRICREIFKIHRLTNRHCKHCDNAFCEDTDANGVAYGHGVFRKNIGVCLFCFTPPKDYDEPQGENQGDE